MSEDAQRDGLADLGSACRPLRVPGMTPGTTIEIACEALAVGSIGVSVRAVRSDPPSILRSCGFAIPAPDPFAGRGGAGAAETARHAVQLLVELLVREDWLHPAPDWEMCTVLGNRAQRMAVDAASGGGLG